MTIEIEIGARLLQVFVGILVVWALKGSVLGN